MFGRFTAWILDHRAASILLLVVTVVLTTAGIVRLGADFSVRRFFAANDPETVFLGEHLARWNEEDLLVVVVDGRGGSLLTRDRLRHVEEVREALDGLEVVSRAIAATSVPIGGQRVAGAFIPTPLLGTLPRDDAALPAWRERVLADGRVTPTLIGTDGEWGALLVQLAVDVDDLVAVRGAVKQVHDLVDGFDATDDLSWRVAGVPAIRADILRELIGDQLLLVPLATAFMALLLLGLFRSTHGVLIPGVAAAVPIAMLLGWMGWAGEPIGLLNQIYLVLIPALAVSDAIHFVSRYHEETATGGAEKTGLTDSLRRQALIRTMQAMGIACFLTSFTNLAGFASLNATDLVVLRRFGTYAGVGICFSYLTVLLIVPLALTMTRRTSARPTLEDHDALGRLITWATRWPIRNPGSTLLLTALVTGLGVLAGSRVQVDFRITETFDEENPVTLANRDVDEHLGGLLALELDLEGPPGAFHDPAVLAAVLRAEDRVATVPEVRAVWGVGRQLAWTSHTLGGPLGIPTDPAVLARVAKLADQGGALDAFVTPERDHARMVVRMVDIGAVGMIDLAARIDADVESELASVGLHAHPTGTALVAYRGLAQVSSDLTNGLVSATLVIGFVVGLLFRSAGLGILSLVPNLVPLAIGYGMMGVLGWSLDPAPAVVFGIALGLAVDSSIHVLARFREERLAGRAVAEAVERAIHASGRAVSVTAVILTVGMGVNALSSFPANQSFGILGALVAFVALVCNLVVLPALLLVVYGRSDTPS